VSGVLRSSLLTGHGFSHGFSTREGGVSAAPFDSLNLARNVGDDPAAVAENHRRFAEALGVPAAAVYEVTQVHGAVVHAVGAGDQVAAVRRVEADALAAGPSSTGEAVCLAIRTADCVPVLIADPESRAVAAAHAGWRGIVAGVIPAAIRALAEAGGGDPSSFVAAIGPHIRVDAFEVGDEVAREIEAAAPGCGAIRAGQPRPHADLSLVVRAHLGAGGVHSDSVDDVGGCTFVGAERFFSYRRDGSRSGRLLSAIVGRGML